MIEESELLRSYVRGIRSLSGAESATLFVAAPFSRILRPLLVHEGEGPGVPELADLERATAFAAETVLEPPGKAELPIVVDSELEDAGLIPLPSVDSVWGQTLAAAGAEEGTGVSAGRRRTDSAERDKPARPAAWLGLTFPKGSGRLRDLLASRSLPATLREEDSARWWDWLFLMGGAMSTHARQVLAILRDPITGLADRAGFQAVLQEELEKSQRDGSAISLLLINPDGFGPINERFGREAGDQIIREISTRIRSALRSSDPVARYGGVIFAAILVGADYATARGVADKVYECATEGAFLDGAVRLGFSVGIAATEPGGDDAVGPLGLVRRADQALNAAKRRGGGCIVEWESRSDADETGALDKLSGIFTGNMAKDYRNMVLLSDCIDVIAEQQDFDGLAGEMVDLLYRTFKPDRAALFTRDDEGNLVLLRGLTRQRNDAVRQKRVETVELEGEALELVRLAIASGEPREGKLGDPETGQRLACGVPLTASGGASHGCLYIDGGRDVLSLELSDLIFLKALGAQLAVALDRAQLTEREQSRQEHEKKRLRAELNELRQAVQQSKLVYRSAEIEALVATARRVAPTDATVLITGESGTGKELMARTVHELSNRREQPFVIVDCGSIATTLIESELFGHEKGAYTGAQQRRVGRLAEANGGSVLLDEIGELPLEVQSKLLRFVQEKQFTPVGGTRQRRVDVRIIAATNRDLASEVTAGRFREDLYYRLNVVRLQVPPLRERPDDVLHLARHFVEAFAVRYQKSIHRISSEAEQLIQSYPWPGNVRELQNRLMQAVILCESDTLGANEIELPEAPEGLSPPRPSERPGRARETGRTFGDVGVAQSPDELRGQLRAALGHQIELAIESGNEAALPLGRWLADDLILEANDAAKGVARRGAATVGIPETTFRRRLSKASQQVNAGLSPRTGSWDEVRSILARWVAVTADVGEDLLDQAERILLEEILERLPDDTRRGSSLLGVTAPTFRSRVSQLAALSHA